MHFYTHNFTALFKVKVKAKCVRVAEVVCLSVLRRLDTGMNDARSRVVCCTTCTYDVDAL